MTNNVLWKTSLHKQRDQWKIVKLKPLVLSIISGMSGLIVRPENSVDYIAHTELLRNH